MQTSLFDELTEEQIDLGQGCSLRLLQQVLPAELAGTCLQRLAALELEQTRIRIAGRDVPIPRLNAWHGDPEAAYAYSGVYFSPRPWTGELQACREYCEQHSRSRFNSVLVNLYRDGNDSVAWHADDEPYLGRNPLIASLSLGAARRFRLKHRSDKQRKPLTLTLPHNSLLIMQGALQHHWLHTVPKTRQACAARINLTFRRVIPDLH
ncbi:alpha-ketoglutarate-dependent dioxygenase AlkB [Granulosicoccaceae sp. 1_MG-2023]|nr:alpha-ketoglutarate-dependent dioxygenase AlkB [Granulosicoccaceae sp. 1_MG-2023]